MSNVRRGFIALMISLSLCTAAAVPAAYTVGSRVHIVHPAHTLPVCC